jgi:hypothetical protein
MTATLTKSKTRSKRKATRSILLNIPAVAPDPKYQIGDRVSRDDFDESYGHSFFTIGLVTGLRWDGDQWQYFVDPTNDRLSEKYSDFSLWYLADPWICESDLEAFSDDVIAQINKTQQFLKSEGCKKMERAHAMTEDVIITPAAAQDPAFIREWERLYLEGYLKTLRPPQ